MRRDWERIYRVSYDYSTFLEKIVGEFQHLYIIDPPERSVPIKISRMAAVRIVFQEDVIPFLNESLPKNIDGREAWILRKRKNSRIGYSRKQAFLCAIQKGLGLYPRPKWWRVRERLLQRTQSGQTND